jgi:F420-dependent oxidoreductase-like protein
MSTNGTGLSVAIAIGGSASGAANDWPQRVEYAVEAERLGVGSCWAGEAWGEDAFTPLAFLAARTTEMRFGTGIAQISARVPSMMAMTAITMAEITEGRFNLGLGVSGPQVVEGLHGVRFSQPIGHLAEYLDILQIAFSGAKLQYSGEHWVLPLPGGEGKALRLVNKLRYPVPIYIGTVSPRGLALVGARADGWIGTCFVPEAADVLLGPIREAATAIGRDPADLDIHVPSGLAFGDDVPRMLRPVKAGLARYMAAMGSPKTNFYRRALARAGYADAAEQVLRVWTGGDRDGAIECVPDELALRTSLVGDDQQVLSRLRAYAAAGVKTLRLDPAGATISERLDTLARGMDLIKQVQIPVADAAQASGD